MKPRSKHTVCKDKSLLEDKGGTIKGPFISFYVKKERTKESGSNLNFLFFIFFQFLSVQRSNNSCKGKPQQCLDELEYEILHSQYAFCHAAQGGRIVDVIRKKVCIEFVILVLFCFVFQTTKASGLECMKTCDSDDQSHSAEIRIVCSGACLGFVRSFFMLERICFWHVSGQFWS